MVVYDDDYHLYWAVSRDAFPALCQWVNANCDDVLEVLVVNAVDHHCHLLHPLDDDPCRVNAAVHHPDMVVNEDVPDRGHPLTMVAIHDYDLCDPYHAAVEVNDDA